MDSRAGSSTLLRESHETSIVSARQSASATGTLSTPIPSCLWLFYYIYNMKSESAYDAHHYAQIYELFFAVNIWIITQFVDYCSFFSCSFPHRKSSILMALNFLLFVSPICTVHVNDFVASECPLHLLFLEGFDYHQRSLTLSSPLYNVICVRYMY